MFISSLTHIKQLLRCKHTLIKTTDFMIRSRLAKNQKIIPYIVFVLQNTTYDIARESLLRKTLCKEYGYWNDGKCHSPENVSDFIVPPGQRKIFYGPHNNFTAGFATHLADNLGITRKGETQNIIKQFCRNYKLCIYLIYS